MFACEIGHVDRLRRGGADAQFRREADLGVVLLHDGRGSAGRGGVCGFAASSGHLRRLPPNSPREPYSRLFLIDAFLALCTAGMSKAKATTGSKRTMPTAISFPSPEFCRQSAVRQAWTTP